MQNQKNTVFVGKKGVMSYITAVVKIINDGNSEVIIKARGKLISRAVDVAEIVRSRFMPNLIVDKIETSTETLQSEQGGETKVSAIEIKLKKEI